MGAWAYCRQCAAGMGKPNLYETMIGTRACPRCHHPQDPGMTKDEVLVELAERVDELEHKLAQLTGRIDTAT